MFWKMLQFWQRQRTRRSWLGFVASLLLLTTVLALPNGLGQLDRLITDFATRLDARKASADIVIITIDDDSIDVFGRWPWARGIYSKVFDQLKSAGALAVGFDVLMTEPDQSSEQGDEVLARSIARNNPIVLPILAHQPLGAGGWWEVREPAGEMAQNAAALAHINLQLDVDGAARSIYLREGRDGVGGGVWPHMALALWQIGQAPSQPAQELPGIRASQDIAEILNKVGAQGADGRVISKDWLRDYWMLISYAGSPGSFKRFSFVDVYTGQVPAQEFQGKYVLVGVTAAGLGDAYVTPMAGKEALMPGVEIIANVLDGLLQGEYRYAASGLQNVLFNVLLVLCAIPLFYLGRPRTVLAGMMMLMVADIALMLALRRFVGIQVMPAASLICLALAYPWWSWRRLEMAMRQIRTEFSRMRRENGFFQAPERVSGDALERDVQAFESAAWQLRDLQQMVRQSLNELPYAVLVVNASGQVILSNAQARKIFSKVDPPLPTMALEPAMGSADVDGTTVDVPEHHLSVLLASRFLGSVIYQQATLPYAKVLMEFFQQHTPELQPGSIEVRDTRNGGSYLLKVVERVMTIERSQGWVVSLMEFAGERDFEIQRDQAMRYLQENVYEPLVFLQKEAALQNANALLEQGIAQITKQTQSFLAFEYACGAIYLYEKIDLTALLSQVLTQTSTHLGLAWEALDASLDEEVFMQGDAFILETALADLLQLLVAVCGAEKMPMVRIKYFKDKGQLPSAPVNFVQIYLIAQVGDAQRFAQRSFVFDELAHSDFVPLDVDADVLKLWGIHSTMTRHAGSMKVQKTENSLGVKLEFLV